MIKGICKELENKRYNCICSKGYRGQNCEELINNCQSITCKNKGICQSSIDGYQCRCLYGTFGIDCENVERSLVIRRYVSKSVSYIFIIILISFICFIVILDVLKYVFGIDPVEEDRRKEHLYSRKKKGFSKNVK